MDLSGLALALQSSR